MGRRKKEPRSVHRENIVSAASVLFMEKGIAAATMDDIAKAVWYSIRKNFTMGLSKKQFLEYGFSLVYDSIARCQK